MKFTEIHLCHFTNQAQGDRRGSKFMNFAKKLILCNCILFGQNTKCKWFRMKISICDNFYSKNTKCQGYCNKGNDQDTFG